MRPGLDLGRQVLDKGLVTKDGVRAGMVDDLELEIGDGRPGDSLPEVCGIVTGPMALGPFWWRPLRWMVRGIYGIAGLHDPEPVMIPWNAVTYIQAVIHLSMTLKQSGLHAGAEAVNRRFISRIPGA